MAYAHLVLVLATATCLASVAQCLKFVPGGSEPQHCDPMFDFNNKLLEKMIKVAHRMDVLEEKLDSEIDSVKQSMADVQTDLTALETAQKSKPTLGSCPDGWVVFKTSCYYWDTRKLDFNSAKTICSMFNSKLVEIETPQEDAFLRTLLRKCEGDNFWIGLTDEESEGTWHVPSQISPISYKNWGSSQPNGGRTSNCGAIWKSFGYTWVDEPCTNKFHPVCEKPSLLE